MDAAIFLINSLQNGGAERVVVNQSKEIARKGIKVFIIMLYDMQYYIVDNDIEIITLYKKRSGFIKILSIPVITSKFNKEVSRIEKNYKIILATVHLPYAHIICRLSRYTKRFLYVMHNPQYQFYKSKSFLFRKKISFLYDYQKIVAVSCGVKNELLEEYGLRTNWICTIYNPINFNEIRKMEKEQIENSVINGKYILFVGRLTFQKRVDRLLRAYKLSGLYRTHKLIILGIGEQKDFLEGLCKELGLHNYVEFMGWENNVYKYMKQADLLVCSSDYESFGMVIAEALYCGCKVVSTNCKYGPNEILQGSFSEYLSELKPESLAEIMKKAIVHYPDKKTQLVQKFNVVKIMNDYLEVYQNWCGMEKCKYE